MLTVFSHSFSGPQHVFPLLILLSWHVSIYKLIYILEFDNFNIWGLILLFVAPVDSHLRRFVSWWVLWFVFKNCEFVKTLDLYLLGFFEAWLRVVCSSAENLHLLLLGSQNNHPLRINLNKTLNLRFSRICRQSEFGLGTWVEGCLMVTRVLKRLFQDN